MPTTQQAAANRRRDALIKKAFSLSVRHNVPVPEDQTLCIICQDDWEPQDSTVAGQKCRQHVFHYECLEGWVVHQNNRNATFPLCATVITTVWPDKRPKDRSHATLMKFLVESWVVSEMANMEEDLTEETPQEPDVMIVNFSQRLQKIIDVVVDRHEAAVSRNDGTILADLDVHPDVMPWYDYTLEQGMFWQNKDSLYASQQAMEIAIIDSLLRIGEHTWESREVGLYDDISEPYFENQEGVLFPVLTTPQAWQRRKHAEEIMKRLSPTQLVYMLNMRRRLSEQFEKTFGSKDTSIYPAASPYYTIKVDDLFSRNPLPSSARLIESQYGKLTREKGDPGWSKMSAWPRANAEFDGVVETLSITCGLDAPLITLENMAMEAASAAGKVPTGSKYETDFAFPSWFFNQGGRIEFGETQTEGWVCFAAPGGRQAKFIFKLPYSENFRMKC